MGAYERPSCQNEDQDLEAMCSNRMSTLVSRNITVSGRRTSVRLEPEMWEALKDITIRENCTIHDVCSLISVCKKGPTSLTAAIRVFIMLYFKASSTEEGHRKAGHGNIQAMMKRVNIESSATKVADNAGSRQAMIYSSNMKDVERRMDAVEKRIDA